MQNEISVSQETLLVACLCADWCGTCRTYRSVLESVGAGFSGVRTLWIDIEDEAALVDPLDVDDFPTLLLATRDRVVFFGTVMPHKETLQRLIAAQQGGPHPPFVTTAPVQALAERLWQRTNA